MNRRAMKIILSRKGFDSTNKYGACPSPIIDGARLVSLPIPETQHLDPDLRKQSYKRAPGWRPLFGQCDQAQTHLCNQHVDRGDLFLFYGLFKEAAIGRREDGTSTIRYVSGAPRKHVIWGWLAVGESWKPPTKTAVPAWAQYHPHFPGRGTNNAIYAAADNVFERFAGAGTFDTYHDDLCLTTTNGLKNSEVRPSRWQLPKWFAPKGNRVALTYHPYDHRRWTVLEDAVLLQTRSPGQEFVLDTEFYPEAIAWARTLIEHYGTGWHEAARSVTA